MKLNCKKVLAALLCAAMLTVPAYAADLTFKDIPADAWYYADVEFAVGEGLVNGRSAEAFCPEEYMTAAEAVKLAACMHVSSHDGEDVLENGDPWYAPYVTYAKENGIIEGDFAWNDPVTREDYIAIFARALPEEDYAAINEIPDGALPDVPANAPRAAEIYKLARAGIVQGDENRNINPGSPIRRCEVAAILTRMMKKDARISFTVTAEAKPVRASDFTGKWQDRTSGRASFTIMPSEEYPFYDVTLTWGNGVSSTAVWTMKASFDEETGRLTYENGKMEYVNTDEAGDVTHDVQWTDGQGALSIGADGEMRWEDSREERSADFRIERMTVPVPTADELAESFFGVIGGIHPGTAGSSLRQAKAIADVLEFAGVNNELWAADVEILRDNLLAAWIGLTEEEQKAFDESFISVLTQARDAWADWDANKAPFEDAGVFETMERLMGQRTARLSWDVLTGNALTMGNSEGN